MVVQIGTFKAVGLWKCFRHNSRISQPVWQFRYLYRIPIAFSVYYRNAGNVMDWNVLKRDRIRAVPGIDYSCFFPIGAESSERFALVFFLDQDDLGQVTFHTHRVVSITRDCAAMTSFWTSDSKKNRVEQIVQTVLRQSKNTRRWSFNRSCSLQIPPDSRTEYVQLLLALGKFFAPIHIIQEVINAQEAQLLQRGCAMLRVTEYLLSHSRSLNIIRNNTLEYSMYNFAVVFHCNYTVHLYIAWHRTATNGHSNPVTRASFE